MSIFDPRTLALVVTLVGALQAAVMILLYRLSPRYLGIELWVVGMILAALGSLLIMLHGTIPAFISVILANLLGLISIALLVDGTARFLERPSSSWAAFSSGLILAVFLGYLFYSYMVDDLRARTTLLFLSTALLCGRGVWLLHRFAPVSLRYSAIFTATVLASYTGWLLLRSLSGLAFAVHPADPMAAPINAIAPLILLIFGMLVTGGFAAMIIQRLWNDLRQQEELFRLTFDQAPLGGAIVGLDFRLLRVNAALCHFLGYSLQEITTRTFLEATYPEDQAADMALAKQLFNGEIDQYVLEKRYRRKDGTITWGRLLVRLVYDQSGKPRYYLGLVEDINARVRSESERRRLELSLQTAQRLESLAVLASGIAHDFNNLLTPVIGHAELMALDLPPDSPAHASLASIISGGRRAAELTHQLLAYAGKSPRRIGLIQLNQIVSELDGLLRPALGQQAHLEYRLSETLPLINADNTQIRQVVLNLLINAAEAIGEQAGSIQVHTMAEELTAESLGLLLFGTDAVPGSYACLTVSDNGSGMEASERLRVFEPFYSTKFIGRGLGLAAVHGIVRSHNGALDVQTAKGIGTTFRIWLPIAQIGNPTRCDSSKELGGADGGEPDG